MVLEDSPKIARIEQTIRVLSSASQKVHEYDYALAQVMIGVANQMLADLHSELEQHLTAQRKLQMALENTTSES